MSTDPPADPFRRLADDDFRANAFDDEHSAIYNRLINSLLEELEARPGFGTLHQMLAERAAHTFVLLKARDARPDGLQLNWQDYQRLNNILLGSIDRLFNEAKLGDADDAAKRQIAKAVTDASIDVIDRLPLTEDDRKIAYRRLRSSLEEHLV